MHLRSKENAALTSVAVLDSTRAQIRGGGVGVGVGDEVGEQV